MKKFIFFVINSFFIYTFVYTLETIKIDPLINNVGPTYITSVAELNNYFFFRTDNALLYIVNLSNLESTEVVEALNIYYQIDNELYLSKFDEGNKLRYYLYNVESKNFLITSQYDYLKTFRLEKYYQNNQFFGIIDATESPAMGMMESEFELYWIDNGKNISKKLIDKNKGQGLWDISNDKMHLLLDRENHMSIYNIQSGVEKKVIPFGSLSGNRIENYLYFYDVQFLTNDLILVPFKDKNEYRIYNLDGEEVASYILGDGDVSQIVFFNNFYYALATYRYYTKASSQIVDTTAFRESLVKKGLLYIPHEAKVIKNTTIIYTNPNLDAPTNGLLKKGEEIKTLERSGIKTKVNGREDFWYRIEMEDDDRGWVFGGDIQLGKELEVEKYQRTVPWIETLLYKNYLTHRTDRNMYHPIKAFDNDLDTHWAEKSDGSGIGDYIGFELDKPITVDSLVIYPGLFDKNRWKYFNHLKKITMEIDGKKFAEVKFKDIMEKHEIKLDKPVSLSRFKVVIDEVYPKNQKLNATALTDVVFFYKGKEVEIGRMKYISAYKKGADR